MAIAPASFAHDEITRAQQALRDAGFDLPVDGQLGPQMRAALFEFQRQALKDETPTGELNQATIGALLPERPRREDPVPLIPDDPLTIKRPRLHLVADQPLTTATQDRLDFKPYAEAVAGIINNPETTTPLTIAISAPWGAGKSTLAAMVRERLENKISAGGSEPHVTCAFNAWMHDDARSLGAAFAAEIVATQLWRWGRDKRLEAERRAIDDWLAGKEASIAVPMAADQLDLLVDERRMLGLMNASTWLHEAYAEIRSHLNPRPRNAKRAVNRLRLLLYVAYARRTFGGDPPLTPRHLGRWIAFQERWPEIADLIPGDPALMGKLEDDPGNRLALLTQLPQQLAQNLATDHELARFLGTSACPLGPVMYRLLHFPQANNGTGTPSSPETAWDAMLRVSRTGAVAPQ